MVAYGVTLNVLSYIATIYVCREHKVTRSNYVLLHERLYADDVICPLFYVSCRSSGRPTRFKLSKTSTYSQRLDEYYISHAAIKLCLGSLVNSV